jgi:hypothetical protein
VNVARNMAYPQLHRIFMYILEIFSVRLQKSGIIHGPDAERPLKVNQTQDSPVA